MPKHPGFIKSVLDFTSNIDEVPKTSKQDTTKLFALAVKALCHLYSEDPTQPSIVVSHLRSNKFYMSVVRYNGSYAKERWVIYKTQHKDFDRALYDVATWIAGHNKPDNPLLDLRNFLGTDN